MSGGSDSVDAAFALLDRQLVDRRGTPLGKVDDLEYAPGPGGTTRVSALLCGPGAWAPRLGGRAGRWAAAVWRRLHPAETPAPRRIPLAYVRRVGATVELAVSGETLGLAPGPMAAWFDRHVVDRIPGADHGG